MNEIRSEIELLENEIKEVKDLIDENMLIDEEIVGNEELQSIIKINKEIIDNLV